MLIRMVASSLKSCFGTRNFENSNKQAATHSFFPLKFIAFKSGLKSSPIIFPFQIRNFYNKLYLIRLVESELGCDLRISNVN